MDVWILGVLFGFGLGASLFRARYDAQKLSARRAESGFPAWRCGIQMKTTATVSGPRLSNAGDSFFGSFGLDHIDAARGGEGIHPNKGGKDLITGTSPIIERKQAPG